MSKDLGEVAAHALDYLNLKKILANNDYAGFLEYKASSSVKDEAVSDISEMKTSNLQNLSKDLVKKHKSLLMMELLMMKRQL